MVLKRYSGFFIFTLIILIAGESNCTAQTSKRKINRIEKSIAGRNRRVTSDKKAREPRSVSKAKRQQEARASKLERNYAKAVKAKVDIAAIETSLKLYKLDSGEYPTTEQGLLALIEKPSTEPIPLNWKEKGYLAKARIPKDPWKREYLYLSPGIHDEYDIISYGADGAPGGEGKNKDVNSWELE